MLHVWSEAKHVCYETRAYVRPEGYIEMSYSSLLIITHHYAIHYSSLLIITQIALLIITHHYTTSDGWKIYCLVWRLHAFHTQRLRI